MLVGDWALASEGNFADPAVAAALVVTANAGRGHKMLHSIPYSYSPSLRESAFSR